MKTTKRFAALLMAVVMVFALCGTALADEPGVITGSAGEIPVKKHITMTNNTDGTYYSPNITFSYTISPATSAELAYQSKVGGATILAGVDGGLIGKAEEPAGENFAVTNTPSSPAGSQIVGLQFKSHEVTVDSDTYGADIVETMTLSVVASAFPHAGVYRYKVADSTLLDAIKAAGIERNASYSSEFFVDVYIQNKADGTGLEPAGAVVSTYDPNNTHNVPVKDSAGNYIQATPTTNAAGDGPAAPYDDGQTFSPAGTYPDGGYRAGEDGKLYQLNDGKTAADEPENPNYTDLTLYHPVMDTDPNEQIVVATTPGSSLVKDGDGINEEPTPNFDDGNKNGKPDILDANGGPTDTDTSDPEPDAPITDPTDPNYEGVEPVYDDEGNILGTDGKSYAQPEYIVDPDTGEIIKDNDGDGNVDPDTGDPTTGDTHTGVYQKYRGTYTYKGDVYKTYNVTLKKIVAGSMGDKSHEFAFSATVYNNGLYFKFEEDDANGTATLGEHGTEFGATLNHEEVLNIRGLNPKATVTYTETNNTEETYKVKAEDKGGLILFTEANVAANETAQVYATAAAITDYETNYILGYSLNENDAMNVTYTNTLDQVSPTGIALRYAPYIFMLAAAAMFVVLSRKERDGENA